MPDCAGHWIFWIASEPFYGMQFPSDKRIILHHPVFPAFFRTFSGIAPPLRKLVWFLLYIKPVNKRASRLEGAGEKASLILPPVIWLLLPVVTGVLARALVLLVCYRGIPGGPAGITTGADAGRRPSGDPLASFAYSRDNRHRLYRACKLRAKPLVSHGSARRDA